MTSKTSLNKFNPAYNLFRYSLKKCLGLTFLFTVFMLLICPGYTLIRIYDSLNRSEQSLYNINNTLPTLICGISVATVLCAMLFCFINFSYLYSKKATDVYHALPITRTGLLMARLFASIVPVLIPIVLVYVSMLCMVFFAPVTASVSTILLGMLYNIMSVLFCCSFTLIFLICAGSILDFLISFFAVNVGIILTISIIIELAQNFLTGYSDNANNAMSYTYSPFLFVFINLKNSVSAGFAPGNGIIIYSVKLIIYTFICLIASCWLYNRRKSEKSGVQYAYRFMYYVSSLIVGIVGSFGLGLIFSTGNYDTVFWCFAAAGGVLTTVTFGVITERGFKKIKSSFVTGLCCLVILAGTSVVFATGGLGFSTRVPGRNSVKSVSVEFNGYVIKFTNPEKVIALHDSISSDIGAKKADDFTKNAIRIDYELKGGFEQHRLFYVDYNEYMKQILDIYRSQENIDGIKSMTSVFRDSNYTLSVYQYDEESLSEITSGYDSEGENDIRDVYLTKKEFVALIDAYAKDVLNATENSITLENITEYNISGVDKRHSYCTFYVFVEKSFDNTRSVLDSFNLKERMREANG